MHQSPYIKLNTWQSQIPRIPVEPRKLPCQPAQFSSFDGRLYHTVSSAYGTSK